MFLTKDSDSDSTSYDSEPYCRIAAKRDCVRTPESAGQDGVVVNDTKRLHIDILFVT